MALNKRGQASRGGDKQNRRDREQGVYYDPGPYVAIVTNNVDSRRMGFLTVHIPDLAQRASETFDVRFASPFMSFTRNDGVDTSYESVKQAAGMWVQTPDIGTEVIVMFPSGNPNKGIWIGCLQDRYNNHSMPGHASSEYWDINSDKNKEFQNPQTKKYNDIQPVGEIYDPTKPGTVSYKYDVINQVTKKKPINPHLGRVYKRQGLENDNVRGHTTSSAMREAPSNVFGISTKGRPIKDIKDDPTIQKKLEDRDYKNANLEFFKFATRKHGHTLVMDDGDLKGENELIRLRSSSGHQVLMHDTKGVMYVGNATGTVWLELNNDGTVDLYAQKGVNVRSRDMNFYADNDINIHAKNNISMLADGKFQVDAGNIKMKTLTGGFGLDSKNVIDIKASGAVNIDASGNANIKAGSEVKIDGSCVELGNGADPASASVTSLTKQSKPDTIQIGNGFWGSKENSISTISTRVPTHEPFKARGDEVDTTTLQEREAKQKEADQAAISVVLQDQPTETKEKPGVENAKNYPLEKSDRLSRGSYIKQPEPSDTVGNLSQEETKALIAAIGQRESSGNYQAENQIGYIGKYQFGLAALEDSGYIKKGTYARAVRLGGNPNRVLDDPNVWIRGGGKQAFLNNPEEQERAMEIYTQRNYRTLQRIGVVDSNTTPDEAAGLIAASHLVGPGAVKKWANSGVQQADANGVTATKYYNLGRSAIRSV